MRLVPNWRSAWRFWSTHCLALIAIVAVIPAESFLTIYALVPDDLQFLLPGRTVLIPVLALLAFLARITKQKLPEKPDEER